MKLFRDKYLVTGENGKTHIIKAYSLEGAMKNLRNQIVSAIAKSQGNPFVAYVSDEQIEKMLSYCKVELLKANHD